MSLHPAALLDGPRGRRLALAMLREACRESPEHWRLAWSISTLADALDPRPGSASVLTFTLTDDAADAEGDAAADDEPFTLPELADRLGAAPLERVGRLLPLLRESVDSARYWQEPGGEDLLAESPLLRPALERAADVIARHPDADSWSAPADLRDQWEVEFELDPPPPPRSERPEAPDWAEWREEAVAAEFAARTDRPADPTASWSGAWWSTPFTPLASLATTRALAGDGPLGLHLIEDRMGWTAATVRPATIADSAAVYEIDGPGAWAGLCRRYPLEITASRRHDWYRVTGRDGTWLMPDWSAVARHYDGVHLTLAGYLRAAGTVIPVEGEAASVIAGWSPDETWWLRRERVQLRERDAERWVEDADGEWTRGEA